MIDEAIGKILGMAMAYGVSSMGLFLAYANYRKRTLKADKIMTPTAWMVVGITVLAVIGAVFVVAQLAQPSGGEGSVVEAALEPTAEPIADKPTPDESAQVATAVDREPREAWPMVGIVVPAVIFLLATWLTAGLHRRFSHGGS